MSTITPTVHRFFELVMLLDPADSSWDTLKEKARAHVAELTDEIDRLRARMTREAAHAALVDVLASASTNLDELSAAFDNHSGAKKWRKIYGSLAKNYEQLVRAAEALPDRTEEPYRRLVRRNYARNAFHVVGGIFAALTLHYLITESQAVVVMIVFAGIGTLLEILRRVSQSTNEALMRFPLIRRIARPHEYYRVNSSTWYAFGLLIAVVLYSKLPVEIACVVLAVADPVASNVGRRYGRTKIFGHKSFVGTAAFFGAALVASATYLVATSNLALPAIFAVSAVAAIAGALAELYTVGVDDNFSVPVAVATAVWGLWALGF